MKKIISLYSSLFLGLIFLLIPGFVFAINDFSFDADSYFLIDNISNNTQVPITVKSGSVFSSVLVDTNFMDITLDNGSVATFTVPSGFYFNIAKQSGTDNYSISPACLTNSVTMSATGNVVLRLTVKTTPPSCLSSGGGGGGSGGSSLTAIIGSVSINNGALTTLSPNVKINLSWSNATEVRISDNNQFLNSSWQSVSSIIPWIFSNTNLGTKTIYAQFKNSSSISGIYSHNIQLIKEEEIIDEPVCVIDDSKFDFDLYIVNPDGTQRHMNTNYVKTSNISPGVTRVGFEDSGSDFDYNDLIIDVDTSKSGYVVIKPISIDAGWHHQIKIDLIYNGVRKKDILLWSDSHQSINQIKTINLQQTAPDLCSEETPVICVSDYYKFDFDLYIVNPNGTQRHMNTNYVKTSNIFPGVTRVGFEDSGSDFDYNDLIIDVDTSKSGYVVIKPISIDAGWIHQIRIILLYEGVEKKDILLWSDSHQSINQIKTVNLQQTAPNLCDKNAIFEKIDIEIEDSKIVEEPKEIIKLLPSDFRENIGCISPRIFTSDLSIKSDPSQEIRDLQTFLRCLGYFPLDVSPTAIFGQTTELSVKKFQEYYNIPMTGIVDSTTKLKINSILNSSTSVLEDDYVIAIMEAERLLVGEIDIQLVNRLLGRILLQIEENGQAWYLEPISRERYFMGRPKDAFDLMRRFGLGITNNNFNKFEKSGVPNNFSGRILLKVEENGEAYYINPVDMKMYYLGRPDDAFKIMRELSLGITNNNIRQIPVAEVK